MRQNEGAGSWRGAHWIAIFALLILLCAATQSPAQTPASEPSFEAFSPRPLFVAAEPGSIWTVHAGPIESGAQRWLVMRQIDDAPDSPWVPVATIAGQPLSVATFGDRLAVLYRDGSWAVVSSGSQVTGPLPPSGFRLIGVVGRAGTLRFLARSDTDGKGEFLLEFDGQRFSSPRPVGGVADRALVFDTRSDPDFATSSDGTLQATRSGNTITVVSTAVDQSRRVELKSSPNASSWFSISRENESAARIWWVDAGKVLSQAFALNDGSPVGGAIEAKPLPPPSPPMFERGLQVIGVLSLLLVLFAGGSRTIAAGRVLAQRVPPRAAPLARRLAAGIIDLLPLAACITYLVRGSKLTIFAGMLQFDSVRSELLLTGGVLLYLMLLIALEVQWQCSIGKAIFALRVVAIDGGKPKPIALLVRNLLRLIDFNLVTLLFIPMTPLRQRLGDYLAGTMVVDAADVGAADPVGVTSDGEGDNK